MRENDEALRLEHQLCFPLYAASREIIKTYRPLLKELDLTYTQYVVMMVLWEKKELNITALGDFLYLDSGTLTPLLKKMEAKDFLRRERMAADERNVMVSITPQGEALKKKARKIPPQMQCAVHLSTEEAKMLHQLLYKLIDHLQTQKDRCP